MTNKRKSMNTGDDVHAIAPEVRSHCEAMFKGVQGCCPDKFCLWGPINPACENNQQLLITFVIALEI